MSAHIPGLSHIVEPMGAQRATVSEAKTLSVQKVDLNSKVPYVKEYHAAALLQE